MFSLLRESGSIRLLVTTIEGLARFAISDHFPLYSFIMLLISFLIHSIASYQPLGELLIYHLEMLFRNQTTVERLIAPVIR